MLKWFTIPIIINLTIYLWIISDSTHRGLEIPPIVHQFFGFMFVTIILAMVVSYVIQNRILKAKKESDINFIAQTASKDQRQALIKHIYGTGIQDLIEPPDEHDLVDLSSTDNP